MWLNVHGDVFSLVEVGGYRGAAAAEAVARAKADVAARGLVATIVQNYYGLVAAQRKLASAQQSLREAQQFLDITQKQESGGEVAHSDVVKAQIQVDAAHARRAGRGAGRAQEPARSVGPHLPRLPRHLHRRRRSADDGAAAAADDVKAHGRSPTAPTCAPPKRRCSRRRSASASRAAACCRRVSFDYFYGINANQFATHDPEGHRLLGSVAQVQLNVPLWNWGAAQSKLRQAQLRVQAARRRISRSRSGSCRPTSAPFTARRKSRATRSRRCASRSISRPKACG